MGRKSTIYISTAAEGIIGTLDEGDSISGRINSIITRYGEITSRDCPTLTVGEWLAIIDILNGTWREADTPQNDIARYLWAEIEDAIADGINDKWDIDAADLSKRVRAMTYGQQCAIIEVACRFWRGHDSQEWASDADRLKHFGARLP